MSYQDPLDEAASPYVFQDRDTETARILGFIFKSLKAESDFRDRYEYLEYQPVTEYR